MTLPSAIAPVVAYVSTLHGGKTMKQHVMRVRAIREAVRLKKMSKRKAKYEHEETVSESES